MPLKICQGEEPSRHVCFQTVEAFLFRHDFRVQFRVSVCASDSLLPKEECQSHCYSLTRTQSTDSLASQGYETHPSRYQLPSDLEDAFTIRTCRPPDSALPRNVAQLFRSYYYGRAGRNSFRTSYGCPVYACGREPSGRRRPGRKSGATRYRRPTTGGHQRQHSHDEQRSEG